MEGLILNVSDDQLPEGSEWRTRRAVRAQRPIFTLADGTPVWEAWFFARGRWWCFSHGYDAQLARSGVVFFDSIEQLRAQLQVLHG